MYKDLGDYEKAQELFQMAYDTFKSSLGEEHPNTKVVQEWLGSLE